MKDEPAFPVPELGVADGLTKREYFAGLAMQGILSCRGLSYHEELLSLHAIKIADALLAELEKTQG